MTEYDGCRLHHNMIKLHIILKMGNCMTSNFEEALHHKTN